MIDASVSSLRGPGRGRGGRGVHGHREEEASGGGGQPCRTGAVVTSLRDVASWAWRHGMCGLVERKPLPRSLRFGRSTWTRVR